MKIKLSSTEVGAAILGYARYSGSGSLEDSANFTCHT
jgi:hypothetical protein